MMNIKRITPPKYRVGRYVLNEYELRTLMVEVARGHKPEGIAIKDEKGATAIIRSDGTLSHSLYGLDINSRATLDLMRIRWVSLGKEPLPRGVLKKIIKG